MKAIDISVTIHNGMWSYKEDWKNKISCISSSSNSPASTVYKFELFSHTGTYIETSQHKLDNNILLDNFPINRFLCDIKLIKLNSVSKVITLEDFLEELRKSKLTVETGDSLIICCGWGADKEFSRDFIYNSPFFEKGLTQYLTQKRLNLLGVDIPAIDNRVEPYHAVDQLFLGNVDLLLLAPLSINLCEVASGKYFLNCLPLKISEVSASLCRPVLFKI